MQQPMIKVGTIYYHNITIADAPQMIKGRVRLYQENLFLEMEQTPIEERQGIKQWLSILQPVQTPYFITLFEKIKQGNFLPSTNGVQDVNHFFMLQYETPIQIFDTDQLSTPITIQEVLYKNTIAPITTQTTNITQVFYLPPSLSLTNAEALLQAAAKMFTQINGGEFIISLKEDTL